MRILMYVSGRVLLLLLVLVLATEITARAEDWIGYRTEWLSPFRDQSGLIVRDADGGHGRRNAHFQKWSMNRLGFRGPEVDSVPAPGTLRVVTSGASETFGLYEAPGREYPRQLEDSLTAALDGQGCADARRVEVLNAAMPGMSLPTVIQDVRLRLRRFAPAVILYYPTPAQYLDEAIPVAAPPDSSFREGPPDWRAGLYPRMLDRLREQAKGLIPEVIQDRMRARIVVGVVARHEPGWRFEQVPIARLEAFDADLRALVGTIRGIGAEPVLATHANAFAAGLQSDPQLLRKWERFYPRATGATIVVFDSAAAARTRAVAQDSSVALAETLGSVAPAGFADYAHFTDQGAGQVAKAMTPPIMAATRRWGRLRCTGAGAL